LAKHGSASLYLRIVLEIEGNIVSEDTVFLTSPRFLALPKAKASVSVSMRTPSLARLTFTSPVFQHRLAFELPGLEHRSSDNFFDLYPGVAKTVDVELAHPQPEAGVCQALTWHSLADTY